MTFYEQTLLALYKGARTYPELVTATGLDTRQLQNILRVQREHGEAEFWQAGRWVIHRLTKLGVERAMWLGRPAPRLKRVSTMAR